MNRADHFEAVLARARARPNLAVYDSTAPLDENGDIVNASYVVLHDLGADEIGDNRFTTAQSADSARTMRVVGRCVGTDPNAARRVASALMTQLVGWAPSVAGRACWPLIVDEEHRVMKDTDTSPPLWFVDVDFTYRTEPAG